MDTKIDKKNIICPVCYQIPGREVYQCRNGHVLCDACSAKIETCPQCRESIRGEKRGRNRFMEQTLDGMELDCPFSDRGCGVKKMKRDKLANHSSSCEFGKMVPLCDLLGLGPDCNFKVDMDNLKQVSTHLETSHGIYERNGDIIKTEPLSDFFKPGDYVHTRVLKFNQLQDKIIFVAKKEGDFVSWIFLDLNEDQLHGPERLVKLWADETPKTKWTIPAFPVMKAEEHIKGPIVKTFIPSLKRIREYGKDDDDYDVSFKLKLVDGRD